MVYSVSVLECGILVVWYSVSVLECGKQELATVRECTCTCTSLQGRHHIHVLVLHDCTHCESSPSNTVIPTADYDTQMPVKQTPSAL